MAMYLVRAFESVVAFRWHSTVASKLKQNVSVLRLYSLHLRCSCAAVYSQSFMPCHIRFRILSCAQKHGCAVASVLAFFLAHKHEQCLRLCATVTQRLWRYHTWYSQMSRWLVRAVPSLVLLIERVRFLPVFFLRCPRTRPLGMLPNGAMARLKPLCPFHWMEGGKYTEFNLFFFSLTRRRLLQSRVLCIV